jgi:hypothetical protein
MLEQPVSHSMTSGMPAANQTPPFLSRIEIPDLNITRNNFVRHSKILLEPWLALGPNRCKPMRRFFLAIEAKS